ncbi:hypothetical protein [Microbacterium sp.]|uniref:hypothetical protein n=1 Tax=Microbacterium sp. TaxID=51671 RepID=UPI0026221DE0|nr:hypothetical protein [Microbacterium sp.]
MSDTPELVTIQVLYRPRDEAEKISIIGRADEDATKALLEAIWRAKGIDRPVEEPPSDRPAIDDAPEDGHDYHPIVLSGESPDDPTGGLPVEYVAVPFGTTFRELRLMVGPRPFAVTVHETGFGGDGIEEFVIWAVEDLLPMGQAMLEIYGVAELVRRIGSARRRHRYRDARLAAESWLVGGGAVPETLRSSIEKQDFWWIEHLKIFYGLDAKDARKLMDALGYRWDSDNRSFYRPMHLDAVN